MDLSFAHWSDTYLLQLLEDSPRVCIWESPYQLLPGVGRALALLHFPTSGSPADGASAGTRAAATWPCSSSTPALHIVTGLSFSVFTQLSHHRSLPPEVAIIFYFLCKNHEFLLVLGILAAASGWFLRSPPWDTTHLKADLEVTFRPPKMPFQKEPFIRINDFHYPVGLAQHHSHLEVGGVTTIVG